MARWTPTRERLTAVLLTCLMAGMGCAGFTTTLPSPDRQRYSYFATPAHDDPWSAKILGWQRRERADHVGGFPELPSVGESGGAGSLGAEAAESAAEVPGERSDTSALRPGSEGEVTLRAEYGTFLIQRRRATARDFAAWVQSQAKRHYIADGPVDHWATLEETLRANGDDCDGLELLAFHGLRELGFDAGKVFRSIVYRPSDGQHHMVTLWFEDANDPWVIDPTGAMTTGMPRMSQLPEWVPLKLFTDHREFSVAPEGRMSRARTLASTP